MLFVGKVGEEDCCIGDYNFGYAFYLTTITMVLAYIAAIYAGCFHTFEFCDGNKNSSKTEEVGAESPTAKQDV